MIVERDILDVINTPGYVTLIEGPPGTGKTSLALKAVSNRGKAKYISYSEPESSLKKKLRMVGADENYRLNVLSLMSGNSSVAVSEIADSLKNGELVVVDTLDAMFYGIKDENEMRPFLQLVYGATKEKEGSLLLISEGLNPASKQIRFVADAIVSVDYESVLDKNARSVKLLKDRDNDIINPLYYITFASGFKLIKPHYVLSKKPLKAVVAITESGNKEVEVEKSLGYNMLTFMDTDVSDIAGRLYRESLVAHYILHGYSVNYWIGPEEAEEEILEDIKSLTDNRVENFRFVYADPKEAKYSSEELLDLIEKQVKNDRYINVVNLLSQEDFAVKESAEFEMFFKSVIRKNVKEKAYTFFFGYSNLRSTELAAKYANVLRRLSSREGFLFWRSVKPKGPLYFVDLRLEDGVVDFIEIK